MLLRRCPFCLAENACEMKFDTKKYKPYLVCKFCMTRAFLRSGDALRGLAVIPDLIDSALRERSKNPDYAEKFDKKIHEMQAYAFDNGQSPPVKQSTTGLPAEVEGQRPFVLETKG